MRTITRADLAGLDQSSLGSPVQPGSVVFDNHSDVRWYVRGVIVGFAPAIAARLPMPVRWLLNADRIASILADVFDRAWPAGAQAPQVQA